MTKILIRFDDICPTMNWEQWDRAKKLLDMKGKVALLGVIPDCQDPDLLIDKPRPDFWGYIKELQSQGYGIAMHGLHHVFDTKADGLVTKRKRSEFAGHTYEKQVEKIREGKEILLSHGIETDIFFAPAHSYDENTLKALSANGFRYLSDGKSSGAYEWHGVKLLPCRASGAANIRGAGCYTSVFHAHEWARDDKKNDFLSFKTTIEKYDDSIVSFDEYCQQQIGHIITMRINELEYLWWENNLRPYVRRIYRYLFR